MNDIRHRHGDQQYKPGGKRHDIPDEFGGIDRHQGNDDNGACIGDDLKPSAKLVMTLHEIQRTQSFCQSIRQESQTQQPERRAAMFYQAVGGAKQSCQGIGE